MTKAEFIEHFRLFLMKQKNSDGESYSPKYVSDKISRLKRMLEVLSVNSLLKINDKSFFVLFQKLLNNFNGVYNEEGPRIFHKCNDYLVILRQIYLMQTKKQAPRFIHYGGKIRTNLS